MSTKTRVAKWDNVKFILILLVVIGHFLKSFLGNNEPIGQGVSLYIYFFHMPAFIFISGIFSKNCVDGKKFRGVFTFLVLFLVCRLTNWYANYLNEDALTFEFFDISDISWYALAVAIYYAITMELKRINHVYVLIFMIFFGCFIGYASDINNFLGLSRIIAFYPFFFIGYLVDGDKLVAFLDRPYIKIISAFILVGLGFFIATHLDKVFWLLELVRGRLSYNYLEMCQKGGGLLRLAWYVLSMIFTLALISVTFGTKCFISTFGTRTAQVYVLHNCIRILIMKKAGFSDYVKLKCGDSAVYAAIGMAIFVTFVLSTKPVYWIMKPILHPHNAKKKKPAQNDLDILPIIDMEPMVEPVTVKDDIPADNLDMTKSYFTEIYEEDENQEAAKPEDVTDDKK